MHALRTAKIDPLPVSVWKRLPSLLSNPLAVYWDLQKPCLAYVISEQDSKGKFVVLINYTVRIEHKQTLINTVRTGKKMYLLTR